MASTPVISQLQVQAWRKKMVKEVVNNVVWVKGLSNRVEVTSILPNAGEKKLPDAVVHWVSDSFSPGIQKTTIPFLAKLNRKGQGGWQPVLGNEESPKMRFKQVNYNLQRKGVTTNDASVEGDMTDYYSIGSQMTDLLTDYFSELTDYNFQRALTRGADEYLTETQYWTGETLTTPPVTALHHPSVFVNGDSVIVPYNATDGTYDTAINVQAAVTTTANTFNLAAADSMVFQADSHPLTKLQKLNWKSGDETVKYVGKLTSTQARQLTTQTGSGTWRELMTGASTRGVDNRAISGIIGRYKGVLWITDERAPLWNLAASTPSTRYQYYIIADERVPTAKGATTVATGTMEVAAMLGKGAIGAAMVKDLNFETEDYDYKFSNGMAASQSCGCERMDLVNTAISARPLNQSSFLYMTATPASAV